MIQHLQVFKDCLADLVQIFLGAQDLVEQLVVFLVDKEEVLVRRHQFVGQQLHLFKVALAAPDFLAEAMDKPEVFFCRALRPCADHVVPGMLHFFQCIGIDLLLQLSQITQDLHL